MALFIRSERAENAPRQPGKYSEQGEPGFSDARSVQSYCRRSIDQSVLTYKHTYTGAQFRAEGKAPKQNTRRGKTWKNKSKVAKRHKDRPQKRSGQRIRKCIEKNFQFRKITVIILISTRDKNC